MLYLYVRHDIKKWALSECPNWKEWLGRYAAAEVRSCAHAPTRGEKTDMSDILNMLDHLCDSLLRTMKPDRHEPDRPDRPDRQWSHEATNIVRAMWSEWERRRRNQYIIYLSIPSLCGEYLTEQLEQRRNVHGCAAVCLTARPLKRETCLIGWSEKHLFWKVQSVNVSKVALWNRNTVYEISARSVRCKDPPKIVEVMEMLQGAKL